MSKLASRSLKSLPTGTHSDGDGLIFRVLPSGRRAFYFQYAQGPKRRKIALDGGEYPHMTLSAARDEVRKLKTMVRAGDDPQSATDAAPTVEKAVAEFLDKHVGELSDASQKYYRILLNNELVSRYGHLNLSQLSDRHLANMLDEIATSGRKSMAAGAYRVTHKLMAWAMKTRRYIDSNPCDMVAAPKPPRARDKVLEDHEISAILTTVQGRADPYAILVQLLFFTAARLDEVAKMRWSDLDLSAGTWRIDDPKNHVTHIVPLSRQARALLGGMTRHGEWVISASLGKTPFNGVGKCKSRLNDECGITDWRNHDIRRTVATLSRKLGASRETVKAILNHKEASVTGIYDRWDMLPEKTEALQKVADDLDRITGNSPDTSSVVQIRAS